MKTCCKIKIKIVQRFHLHIFTVTESSPLYGNSFAIKPNRAFYIMIELWDRVCWKKQKCWKSYWLVVFQWFMMYKNWGNFFYSKKKYFRLVELGPKFGIWAFLAIFALFFRVPKNLIYFNNAFNGYRYMKSTRKELSGGTLMLKKEYCLDRWNCN